MDIFFGATCQKRTPSIRMVFFFGYGSMLSSCHPGYEIDERSSLGRSPCTLPVADAVQGLRVPRSVCNAGVRAKAHTGYRKRGHSAIPPGSPPYIVPSNRKQSASATIKTTAFAVVFLCFYDFFRRNGTYQTSFDTNFDANAVSKLVFAEY